MICLFAGAIFYRLIFIQYVEKDTWIQLAEEIGLQYRVVKATRGNIYSDNGSLLATSLPFYRVALDPSIASTQVFNEGIDSLAFLLSDFYGDRDMNYYRRKIINARESGRQYLILNRQQINYQEKKEMSEWPILRAGRYKGGVIFEKIDKRYLPFSSLGSRTIGFLNSEDRGLVGLEICHLPITASAYCPPVWTSRARSTDWWLVSRLPGATNTPVLTPCLPLMMAARVGVHTGADHTFSNVMPCSLSGGFEIDVERTLLVSTSDLLLSPLSLFKSWLMKWLSSKPSLE